MKADDLRTASASEPGLSQIADRLGVTIRQLNRALDRPTFRRAYDRGRLLYQVHRLSRLGSSYREAAATLGMEAGEFERLTRTDPEIAEVWQNSRIGALQGTVAQLLAAAKRGDLGAIRTVIDRYQADVGGGGTTLSALRVHELAEAFEVSRQTVHNWAQQGAPRNADGSFHLASVIRWRQAALAVRHGESSEKTASTRHREAQAKRAELAYRRERASLVDRQEVMAGILSRIAQLRSSVRSSIPALSVECQGLPAPLIRERLMSWWAMREREQVPTDWPDLQLPPDLRDRWVGLCRAMVEGPE